MISNWNHKRVSFVTLFVALAMIGLELVSPLQVYAQGSIRSGRRRPFVVGVVPVVGNGVVGGVLIDSKGVVSRADQDRVGQLRKAREKALQSIGNDLSQTSQLRKISLRGLERAIIESIKQGVPASDKIQNLAGLQSIRYVFVYPDQHDIVLAGFAEGWKLDAEGNVVGNTTGRPVLQLDDLIVALQTAEASLETPISCSIDPTEQGIARLRRFLKIRNIRVNRRTLANIEKIVGPQQISLTTVPANSHFAHVLVAADFRMKRLGMNLEAAPIDGLPSYIELLKSSSKRPRNMMPRWWLAPDYEPLLTDAEGLSWELRGSAVQGMTEANAGPLAKRWADSLTEHYEALSKKLPIFAKLKNCMDLAVIATLIVEKQLTDKAGYSMPVLMDPKQIGVAEYHVPKTVSSRASSLKKGRQWIISVSGGVDFDVLPVVGRVARSNTIRAIRTESARNKPTAWWWD